MSGPSRGRPLGFLSWTGHCASHWPALLFGSAPPPGYRLFWFGQTLDGPKAGLSDGFSSSLMASDLPPLLLGLGGPWPLGPSSVHTPRKPSAAPAVGQASHLPPGLLTVYASVEHCGHGTSHPAGSRAHLPQHTCFSFFLWYGRGQGTLGRASLQADTQGQPPFPLTWRVCGTGWGPGRGLGGFPVTLRQVQPVPAPGFCLVALPAPA